MTTTTNRAHGRTAARNALALTCQALAMKMAGEYCRRFDIPPGNVLDFAQEAFIGILEGANTYDRTKSKFSTWASWQARAALQRYHRVWRRAGFNINNCRGVGVSTKSIAPNFAGLVDGKDGPVPMVDLLPAPAGAEAPLAPWEARQLLRVLTGRLRQIVVLRFWQDMSRDEVGRKFGVTRERVAQLERKALARLRQALAEKFPTAAEAIA